MQAIVETLFDAIYLITVITLGIIMIQRSKGNKQFRLFGIMAVVLAIGDSFHLIPRAIALCTTGLENFTYALGMLMIPKTCAYVWTVFIGYQAMRKQQVL